MNRIKLYTLLITMLSLTWGCSSDNSFGDLQTFMQGVKSGPKPPIEPLPPIITYDRFIYRVAGSRAPFEKPLTAEEKISITKQKNSNSNIRPDFERTKEFLESFDIESLVMVGTISQNNQIRALVQDSEGGVHMVEAGNYVGRNHGKVLNISELTVAVSEIIPDGTGGWLKRPNSLGINGDEQ